MALCLPLLALARPCIDLSHYCYCCYYFKWTWAQMHTGYTLTFQADLSYWWIHLQFSKQISNDEKKEEERYGNIKVFSCKFRCWALSLGVEAGGFFNFGLGFEVGFGWLFFFVTLQFKFSNWSQRSMVWNLTPNWLQELLSSLWLYLECWALITLKIINLTSFKPLPQSL